MPDAQLSNDELIALAREDYGELIDRILRWPEPLGVDVHLIGGDVVQYHPDGQRFIVNRPSDRAKLARAFAALRGTLRRLIRR